MNDLPGSISPLQTASSHQDGSIRPKDDDGRKIKGCRHLQPPDLLGRPNSEGASSQAIFRRRRKKPENRKLGVKTPGRAGSAFTRKGSATKDVHDTYKVNSRVDASDTKPDLPADHFVHLTASTSKTMLGGAPCRSFRRPSAWPKSQIAFLRALVAVAAHLAIGLAPPSFPFPTGSKQSRKKQ